MNARDVLASVTGFCDACGAGPGVVCDPFCMGVAASLDDLQEGDACPHCGAALYVAGGYWLTCSATPCLRPVRAL